MLPGSSSVGVNGLPIPGARLGMHVLMVPHPDPAPPAPLACCRSFGHGTLDVINSTHALWQWYRNQVRCPVARRAVNLAAMSTCRSTCAELSVRSCPATACMVLAVLRPHMRQQPGSELISYFCCPLQDQGSGPQSSVSDAVYVYRSPTCANKQGVAQPPPPPAAPVTLPSKVQNAVDQVRRAQLAGQRIMFTQCGMRRTQCSNGMRPNPPARCLPRWRGLPHHATLAAGTILKALPCCCAQLGQTVSSIFGNLGVQPLAATVTTGGGSSFQETPPNDDNQNSDHYAPAASP